MPEHRLPVTRTARFVTLGPLDTPVTQLWFAFHGYGQLATEFAESLRALEDPARLVVVPEGLSRFYLDQGTGRVGASWMTREDREQEIADYLGYLDALYAHVTARATRTAGCTLHLLGFSQGAATATRWAVEGAARPDQLILWGGDVPPDLDAARVTERLADVRVCLVVGTRDRYITTAVLTRQTAALDRLRIRHEVHRFEGGHRLDDETLRKLAQESVAS